jgi:hypothetical protein
LKLLQGNTFGSFVTKRLGLPLAFLLATAGLQATSFTFEATSSTACGPSLTCDGSATFTITGTDTFTVTLNNLLTDITAAGQLVTDLYFSLAGSVSMVGSNGTFVTIATDGTPTTGTTGSTGWGFGSNNGVSGTYLLCVICGNGVSPDPGVPPSQGIIDVQSSYADANDSISKTSGPHNPFLESGATFSFTTSATLDPNATTSPFGDVALSFGTTFGTEVTTGGGGGGPAGGPTPEPVSMLLTGAGLVGLATLTRRRQKKARV